MKSHVSLALSALLLLTPWSAAVAQSKSEVAATAVAKEYVERLKSAKVADAVTEMWDLDAMLSGAFGLTYLGSPDSERTAAQKAFASFLAATFANPKMTQLFSTITVQSAKATAYSDSLVAVTLELTGQEGKFHAVNTLLLSKAGKTWHIIDQRQGTSMSMRASLVIMWAQGRRDETTSIATVLDNATAEFRRKVEGAK
jgi:hypothetical protein